MAREWRDTSLGDVIRLQRGHDLPDKDRTLGLVPVMGSFGVTGWHNEARAQGPGVTIGRSGASIGVISFIREDYWPLNTCLYVTDFQGNDPRFCCYWLSTLGLANYNSGSAQPSLNRNYIYDLPVRVPDPEEQRAIAHILGTLDDKIELNRRMNETLEAMARALFKSWFVDFDPVRAKAEGRDPGLPKPIADLFPDCLESSDLRDIPAGWGVGTLGDMVGFLPGYAFKSKDWTEQGVPVVKIGSIKPGIIDLNEVSYVSDKVADEARSYRLKPGALVIGMTGYVGEVGLVPPTVNLPLLNQRVGKVILEKDGTEALGFTYALTRRTEFKVEVEVKSQGTAQANVSSEGILSIKVIVPPKPLINVFNQFCTPLLDRILSNHGECHTLASIRDALLHKLISAELRVTDAEQFLKARGL